MIPEDATAPDFTLDGVIDGTRRSYSLSRELEAGNRVLLLFYPADFSPVSTRELCAIRDAEWLVESPGLLVWATSGDSTYAHRAFAAEFDLNFPLLTDSNGAVAERYDAVEDEWEGNHRVPKRSVFLVDADRRIRYAWQTDDPHLEPDPSPALVGYRKLLELGSAAVPADFDVSVDYDETVMSRSSYEVGFLR